VSRVSAQGDLTTGLPAVPLDAPRVGDEARAWSADLGGVEVVTVAWRSANVAAWISVQSFDAESAERGAFAAVRKQQRRIEVALN
jgi:hypothetical protein